MSYVISVLLTRDSSWFMEILALALHVPTVANLTSSPPLQQFCTSYFFFWLCHMACGILVPQPGIEPAPSAVQVWRPNHWTARELIPCKSYFFFFPEQFCKSYFCRVLLSPPCPLLPNGELPSSSSLLFLKPDGVW